MKSWKYSLVRSAVVALGALAGALGCGGVGQQSARAAVTDTKPKPAVVLVHGAFADGSAWQQVIQQLGRDGFVATAVQNSLFSFQEDVANTKRVIENQSGPVVVVGHSYGGAVITAAAAGNPNVKALVYVTAFAPERGETVGALYESLGKPALLSVISKDSQGFVSIPRARYHDSFANDVSEELAQTLAAVQKPINAEAFGVALNVDPAWKSTPSWYLVCSEDRAITPELQRHMAKRIGATVVEVKASHVPFLSKPEAVTNLIESAASAVTPAQK